jgi:hypothetical protein
MANTNTAPAYVALLRSKNGATSKALQEAMNRKYAPTIYQLRPIADRMGFELLTSEGSDFEDGLKRYYFAPLVAKAPRKAKAAVAATPMAATKSAIVTAKAPKRAAKKTA